MLPAHAWACPSSCGSLPCSVTVRRRPAHPALHRRSSRGCPPRVRCGRRCRRARWACTRACWCAGGGGMHAAGGQACKVQEAAGPASCTCSGNALEGWLLLGTLDGSPTHQPAPHSTLAQAPLATVAAFNAVLFSARGAAERVLSPDGALRAALNVPPLERSCRRCLAGPGSDGTRLPGQPHPPPPPFRPAQARR